MIIEHFLHWINGAKAAERASAADALARAYLTLDLSFEDRCTAEAALTMLLDDPSPIVRRALAEAVSLSPHAPAQIIAALVADQPDIASIVIARSPVVSDLDLVDRVATAPGAVQSVIAGRPRVSVPLAAALAEVGEAEAVVTLLGNSGADIAELSFHRIAERLGDNAAIRGALFDRPDLPLGVRHGLIAKASAALGASPLLKALMGEARAVRITGEACLTGSVAMIESAAPADYPALAEHLRLSGGLTVNLLLRIVAQGKLDFFAAALVALTRQKQARVTALLANGRDTALTALFGAAGILSAAHGPLLSAIVLWREVAIGRRNAGVQEVTWEMLRAVPGVERAGLATSADREIAGLIKAIHLDFLRRNARGHALAVAAAA